MDNFTTSWSPGDKYYAVFQEDKTIKLHEFPSGQERTLASKTTDWGNEVVFSSNEERVAAMGEDGLVVWDTKTGRIIRKKSSSDVFKFSFSSDGKILAFVGVRLSPISFMSVLWVECTCSIAQSTECGAIALCMVSFLLRSV